MVDSVAGKFSREAFSQLPRVIADDVVIDGAVAVWPAKHVHTNLLLCDLALPALEAFRDDIREIVTVAATY